jgi:heat shock protein HslJ
MHRMKWLLVLLLFLAGILSCHTSKTSSGKTDSEKNTATHLNGNWQLQMLFASDSNWAKQPFININLNDKTFSGNSGCNSITGKFAVGTENYIAFDKNFISTKMACTGNYEKAFLSTLLKINRYTINKDELELGQGEIVLMKFRRGSGL